MRKQKTRNFALIITLLLGLSLSSGAQENANPFEDLTSTLKEMERERPRPEAEIISRAEKAIGGDAWKQFSADQQIEVLNYALEAKMRQTDKDREKVIEYIDSLIDQHSFSGQLLAGMRIKKTEQALESYNSEDAMQYANAALDTEGLTAKQAGVVKILQARVYERMNQPVKALELAESALESFDQAFNQGEQNFSWDTMNNIKWAGALARDVVLDNAKAVMIFEKMEKYAGDSTYWSVPAQMEIALVARNKKEFEKASEIYEEIEKIEEGRHLGKVLPARAAMVFYDMDDKSRGKELMQSVITSEEVHHIQRYRTMLEIAQYYVDRGKYQEALDWLEENMVLPHQPEKSITTFKSTILYRMGQIYERMGDKEKAKEHYRKAMNVEGGEMRDRINARDALESILYFE